MAAISSRLSLGSDRRPDIRLRVRRACCRRRMAAQPSNVAAKIRPALIFPAVRRSDGAGRGVRADARRSARRERAASPRRYPSRRRSDRGLTGLALIATRRRLVRLGKCGGGRLSLLAANPRRCAAITSSNAPIDAEGLKQPVFDLNPAKQRRDDRQGRPRSERCPRRRTARRQRHRRSTVSGGLVGSIAQIRPRRSLDLVEFEREPGAQQAARWREPYPVPPRQRTSIVACRG